jgi:glycine/D-amino acid oxidase-like deaminating enzyme/nitrite reductase/ring-hydroxylating ferredoxin subunit
VPFARAGTAVAPLEAVNTTRPLWDVLSTRPSFPSATSPRLHVDVAIIGAGITGLTSATLLKAAGLSVAVLEARAIGSGVTSGSTGHLTQILDTRYYELEQKLGAERTRLVAQSSAEAIEQIAEIVQRLDIACGFERVPGYLYTEREEHVDNLARELDAARRAGVRAVRDDVPLPFFTRAGLRVDGQAQLDPLAYVFGLARALPGDGCHIFERARVIAIDEGEPCRVHLEGGGVVTSSRIILATHVPLNRVLLTPRVAQYRSYVLSGTAPTSVPGLFWDTEDPYHYLRRHRVGDAHQWLVGGADHKTGQEPSDQDPFLALRAYASKLGVSTISQYWSAQVVEPADGLPLIGRNALSQRVYVATGYSGNGLTFGTLAAAILRDACLERDNLYAKLYAATRIESMSALGSVIGEGVDFPLHLLSDSLIPPDARSLEEIERGEGKTIRVDGERLAVYRDPHGSLHAVSPVCTHLGCHVKFNAAEATWDCPCHGSRFDVDGRVLDGPAIRSLARRELDEAPPMTPRDLHMVGARPAKVNPT